MELEDRHSIKEAIKGAVKLKRGTCSIQGPLYLIKSALREDVKYIKELEISGNTKW